MCLVSVVALHDAAATVAGTLPSLLLTANLLHYFLSWVAGVEELQFGRGIGCVRRRYFYQLFRCRNEINYHM